MKINGQNGYYVKQPYLKLFVFYPVLVYDWNLKQSQIINLFVVKLSDELNSSGSYKWNFFVAYKFNVHFRLHQLESHPT